MDVDTFKTRGIRVGTTVKRANFEAVRLLIEHDRITIEEICWKVKRRKCGFGWSASCAKSRTPEELRARQGCNSNEEVEQLAWNLALDLAFHFLRNWNKKVTRPLAKAYRDEQRKIARSLLGSLKRNAANRIGASYLIGRVIK